MSRVPHLNKMIYFYEVELLNNSYAIKFLHTRVWELRKRFDQQIVNEHAVEDENITLGLCHCPYQM